MINKENIVFVEEIDRKLIELTELEKTLMHAVESTLNKPDVDRDELIKLGFTNHEIDFVNDEKKRVMDSLKFYFSIYFFSGILYCSLHSFKFYRKDLPLKKSLYPWGFLLSTFYFFTIYSMRTFNSKMSFKIKNLLINKKFGNIKEVEDIEKNKGFVQKRDLVENKLKFMKFYNDRNILFSKLKF